jgi:hypothetical protein
MMKNSHTSLVGMVLLLVIFFLVLFLWAKAEQVPHYTYNILNPFTINPSASDDDIAHGLDVVNRPIEDIIRNIGGERLVNLAKCESSLNPQATNGQFRGLFQIGKYWHEDVTDECAYSIECSAQWTKEQLTIHPEWWECNV